MLNKDEFRGKWNQFKGEIKKSWGKLTDDDLKQVEGNYDILVGRLQERYGRAKEEIEKEVEERYNTWNAGRMRQQQSGGGKI